MHDVRPDSPASSTASRPDSAAAVRSGPDRVPPPPRRVAAILGLLFLVANGLFGANAFGVRERFLGSETPERRRPADSRAANAEAAAPARPDGEESALRSQPWWQRVTTLEGDGRATRHVTIGRDALQWRATARCESKRLIVRLAGSRDPMVDGTCPAPERGYSTRRGTIVVEVLAQGHWSLDIEQQVDVPLVEPPLPAMTAADASVVARGAFYRMDQTGTGSLTLYRLPDGSHAVRVEDFYVTPNIDLELRFSTIEVPRTTAEYMAAPASEKVAPLDITTGDMNFVVPEGIDPRAYRSLVVWCPLIDSAYAAATLEFVR